MVAIFLFVPDEPRPSGPPTTISACSPPKKSNFCCGKMTENVCNRLAFSLSSSARNQATKSSEYLLSFSLSSQASDYSKTCF